MKLVDSDSPYGTYAPNALANFFLKRSQSQKNTGRKLERRLAGIFRRLARWNHSGAIIDTEVNGFRWRGNTFNNSSEKKYIFIPTFYDVEEITFLLNYPKEGDGVFLEIGANAGIYSLLATRVLPEQPGEPRSARHLLSAAAPVLRPGAHDERLVGRAQAGHG